MATNTTVPVEMPITTTSGISSVNSTWESLRKQARQLEHEIDGRLVAFSKLATNIGGSSDIRQAQTTELELDDLIKQVKPNYVKKNQPILTTKWLK